MLCSNHLDGLKKQEEKQKKKNENRGTKKEITTTQHIRNEHATETNK